jgi:hypothetical protein
LLLSFSAQFGHAAVSGSAIFVYTSGTRSLGPD